MGRNKFEFDFKELQDELDVLRKMGGNVEQATEKALIKSHEYITPKIEEKLSKSNLPRQGKYSSIDRRNSLKQVIREPNIKWQGKIATIDVGFKLDNSIVPIFLIRGTRNMKAVKGLKKTLEGNETKEKVAEIQHEVIVDEILKAQGNKNG